MMRVIRMQLIVAVMVVAVADASMYKGLLGSKSMGPKPSEKKTMTRSSQGLVMEALARASAHGAPHDGECTVTSPQSISNGCTVGVAYCRVGNNWTANSTAYKGTEVNKAVAMGESFSDQTSAINDATSRLSLLFDVTFSGESCGCDVMTWPEGGGCSLRAGVCKYSWQSGKNRWEEGYRARAWDTSKENVEGESPSWADPSVGVNDPTAATLEAARDLRAKFPDRGCGELPPMIIVPGVTASEIQFKLTNSPPVPGDSSCPTDTNGTWETMFPVPSPLPDPNCYIWAASSQFIDRKFVPSRKGEDTRVIDFGGFTGLPYWDGEGLWPYEISGWEVGKTMFAAPYDWRLPGPALEDTYTQLKVLVENVSKTNGGRKVMLWGYSGGPQPALAFLHRQTQEWKDQYIAWFAATSPVWAGTPYSLALFVDGTTSAGNPGGSKVVEDELEMLAARAMPTSMWYFPRAGTNASISWTVNDSLVTTPNKTYTAFDMVELLTDLGIDDDSIEALKFLQEDADLVKFAAPGVNTVVTYGSGLNAPGSMTFTDITATPLLPKSMKYESGDGVVPVRSSLRSTEWESAQKALGKSLIHLGYNGLPHAACFADYGTPNEALSFKCYGDVLNTVNPPK